MQIQELFEKLKKKKKKRKERNSENHKVCDKQSSEKFHYSLKISQLVSNQR
jgi:hypothetical protein